MMVPSIVRVPVGWACNNRCAHCPLLAPEAERSGEATLASLDELIEQIDAARAQGAAVRLTGGEPLAHPELKGLLSALMARPGPLEIDTNGRMLGYASLLRALERAGLRRLRVGVAGARAEAHDARAGVPGAFDETAAGVQEALAAGIAVDLSATLFAERLGEVPALVDLADAWGAGLELRWPDAAGDLELPSLGAAVAAVRGGIHHALYGRGWLPGRLSVVGLPWCTLPRGLAGLRPQRETGAAPPANCRGCTKAGECGGPSEAQLVVGGSELIRPLLEWPEPYELDAEPAGAVRTGPIETCLLRRPSAERPPVTSALFEDGSGRWVEHRAASPEVAPDAGLLKNLAGRVLDPRGPEARLMRLHSGCRSCARLTGCAAAFVPADDAPPVALERDAETPPTNHARRVPGSSGTPRVAADLLEAWRSGRRVVAVRGSLPVVGRRGSARSVSPQTIHDAVDGLPWKVERVRLPGGDDPERWEMHLSAVEPGRGSVQPQRLAAVALLKRCNLRCIMCQIPEHYPEGDVPAPDLFRTFLELRLHGWDWITTFGGEPLLRADAPDLIRAARLLGFGVDMVTNGHFLDDQRVDALADAGLNFCMVSVDGAEPATHDVVRAQTGSFDEAVAGVSRLRAAAPEMRVEMNSVIVAENLDGLGDYMRLAASRGVSRVNLFLCVSAPVLAPRPYWLDEPTLRDFMGLGWPVLQRLGAEIGVEPTLSPGFPAHRVEAFIDAASRGHYNVFSGSGTRCGAPDQELFVSVRQEVYGCASPTVLESGVDLGRLDETPLGSILAAEAARAFAHEAPEHEPCRMCWRCDPVPDEAESDG